MSINTYLMSTNAAQARAKRILFVDDNATVRNSAAVLLQALGYTVNTAEDGEAAWAELHRCRYDLLITDQQMPKLCGTELVERLQGAGELLPTIMITGMTEAEITSLSPGAAAAVRAFVPKPFYPVELTGAVYQVLHVAAASPNVQRSTLDIERQNGMPRVSGPVSVLRP